LCATATSTLLVFDGEHRQVAEDAPTTATGD
jgi:hypothetical protein